MFLHLLAHVFFVGDDHSLSAVFVDVYLDFVLKRIPGIYVLPQIEQLFRHVMVWAHGVGFGATAARFEKSAAAGIHTKTAALLCGEL